MTNTATPKQVNFINTLLTERVAPEALRNALSNVAALSSREASHAITALLAAPKAPKAPIARPVEDDLHAALHAVPKACYAISETAANTVLQDTQVEGLLFIRTKEYRETRYVRRLHGAPGDFATSKLSRRDSIAILRLIATDSLHYAQEFGKHFTVCGKCGAPLTDEESRALNMGPVCRKAWGL